MPLYNKRNIFLLIISISISVTNNYVLIKLKKFNNESDIYNNDYSPKVLIDNLYNQYYGFLNVGYPPQKTELQISTEDLGIVMKEDICLTNYYYNKNKSLSLSQTHYYDIDKYSKETVLANETIDFPVFNITNNNLSEITVSNYYFIYNKANKSGEEEEKIEKEKEGKACISFGLRVMCESGIFYCRNVPSVLKEKQLTSSYSFNFIYHNEKEKNENDGYDAFLLMGEYPHVYNKEKYHENNYRKAQASSWINEPTWILDFYNYFYTSNGTKISFHLTSQELRIKGVFWFHLDIIIGIKEYFNQIKKHYFDYYENECSINEIDYQYSVITCNKDFNTENFPTLYFYQDDHNYTFELTDKDLFQIRGDKKYFLIVFDKHSNYPWKFGKLFMQKYFFNFDLDSRIIGFYNEINDSDSQKEETKDNNNSNHSALLWILWVVLLIITGVGCFLLGRIIYNKNRKKRANELEDDFEYKQKNNDENFADDLKGNQLGLN